MTAPPAFADLAEIVADLSQSMPRETRFQRLLEVVRRNFPCDAIALLEREGGQLIPRAAQGLSPDALGRRFVIQNHPRLAQLLDSRKPVRFAADSQLPDPYDGLIDNAEDHLYVHDCMGAALYIDDTPGVWLPWMLSTQMRSMISISMCCRLFSVSHLRQ
ncbi:GAF domain-containing protein [Kineobactrum salinum]|uniref:GAF domain-containing protein n=1 Tax=Kineobactrum salinum TaxID=2708301 RepID=UPI0018D666FE|nr:GAF domain-containing protein [Kineobactrum salinum]